jgi:hypothetical protein
MPSPTPPAKVSPVLLTALVALSLAAIALTFCITPDSLSVNLVYQAF